MTVSPPGSADHLVAAEQLDDLDHLEEHGGWSELLGSLLAGNDLSGPAARAAMRTILEGRATPAQLIGFIVALRAKGETAAEISGLLDAVMEFADPVTLPAEIHRDAIDIVGTGGDRSHSVNVSTMAALITAGAGVRVCKHGARAASSKCGTADVLEALGVAIELSPAGVARCVEEAGMGFCLAPRFHPAFRFAAGPRREIGIPTVFNLLGPMANPARVPRQLLGVADASRATQMVESLRTHGSTHAWVVHGGGLDELSTTGPSTVLSLHPDGVETLTIDPKELGFPPVTLDDLCGGDPEYNASVVRSVLAGEPGPARDIAVLNAAGALVVAGKVDAIEDGVELASATVDEGHAAALLERFAAVSQDAAESSSPAANRS